MEQRPLPESAFSPPEPEPTLELVATGAVLDDVDDEREESDQPERADRVDRRRGAPPVRRDEGHRERPPRGGPGRARRLHRVEVDLRRLLGQVAARTDRRRRVGIPRSREESRPEGGY